MGRHASPAILSTETDGSSPILDNEFGLTLTGGVWVYLGGEKMCTGEMWNATSEGSADQVAAVTGHVMCCAPVDADIVAEQNYGTEADGEPLSFRGCTVGTGARVDGIDVDHHRDHPRYRRRGCLYCVDDDRRHDHPCDG
jgi:hypothetical protein